MSHIIETREKRFEQDIETFMLSPEGGYIKGNQLNYDRSRAIDMSKMVSFISSTQIKAWDRYCKIYGDNAENTLYRRLNEEINSKGLLSILRKGINDRGVNIKIAYFMPSSSLNEELVELYNKNILECTRQFAYSVENSNTIDMVLSLNGIPVVAIELKNQITGQSVENGKRQWKDYRDNRELLFQFDKRILVYFAADLYEVYMTTELKKEKTFFFPFNQGTNGAGNVGGAGNPPNEEGYTTSYLWEYILQKDNFMKILQKYMNRQTETKVELVNGKKITKTTESLIFPRYHQLDVVEKIIDDVQTSGSGKNYLIQHSAGSGKSNSIAWLTYRLSTLHNDADENIFNTVFIVTDRRLLNSQLQGTISGFDHKAGQIIEIKDDTPSSQLKEAIEDGKQIVITTLHRFPVIVGEVEKQKGKKFAIIVDEAHSSQSGESAKKLKAVLADTEESIKELAEIEQKSEDEIKDDLDIVTEELLRHGEHGNLSFFAFTATPKPKTLDLFGKKLPNGQAVAFHTYSMRQAIEEGFILDVLKYYTTMETSFEIVKNTPANPELEETPAMVAIRKYQLGHSFAIRQKVEVIVEQFRQITLSKMNGHAKAMVVTQSRAHAVKYYEMIKEYINAMGYKDINPLVAFSGTVKIGDKEYTEVKLNETSGTKISERQLREYFATDMFNTLIVADKYQTGFDEPQLHTMFVDKKLKGVKAVQTLSRLNRKCDKYSKNDTYILDFVNTAEEIQKAFEPFYEDTKLEKSTNVNLIYTMKDKLNSYCLFNDVDLDKFVEAYTKAAKSQDAKDHGKLASLIKPAVEKYNFLTPEKRDECRMAIKSFNRFYAFITQIVRMFDKELHKTYLFCEYLFRLLPKNSTEQINLDNMINLAHNSLSETFSGSIKLNPTEDTKTFKGVEQKGAKPKVDKKELLENIIEKINMIYEGKFTDSDKVIVETIYDKIIEKSSKLKKQAKNTESEMFVNSIFPEEFDKIANECYEEQMGAFSKLFENPDFYKKVMEQMAKAMYMSLRNKK